jgi:hypothetical protein
MRLRGAGSGAAAKWYAWQLRLLRALRTPGSPSSDDGAPCMGGVRADPADHALLSARLAPQRCSVATARAHPGRMPPMLKRACHARIAAARMRRWARMRSAEALSAPDCIRNTNGLPDRRSSHAGAV